MMSESSRSSASDCSVLFKAEGLPSPPLPTDLLHALRLQSPGTFATADWIGGSPVHTAASHWLTSGTANVSAWCGLIERGVHSTTVQVGLAAPRCGIFIRKFVSQAFDDAVVNRRKVEGSFELMRRVLEGVERARAWPAGRRLAIIDDDTQQVLRWGWVGESGTPWDDLAPDGVGWISALISVERLARVAA